MQPAALGRYRIVKVLGRGGMGVVYEGHDPQIDRSVAIKTIALDALSDDERAVFEGRFRSEMRSTGRLQHHNIAALYDTGRDGGTAYIVMELVNGQDLKRHLASGHRFGLAQAVDITIQLLAALEFAHRRQVIHRDVKPANVMLQTDGVVKLCDFGVARLADADATRTQGMVVGSLRYASPEQIMGQPIDARTDIFSAGVLLFELLTGQVPFKGQSDVEVLHRIANDAAPSPRAIEPAITADVDEAVQRALAKNPDERFTSAAEFARALGASSTRSTDTFPSASPASSLTPGCAASPSSPTSTTGTATLANDAGRGRRAAIAAAAGAGVIVLGGGAWWSLRPAPPAPFSTAQEPSQATLPRLAPPPARMPQAASEVALTTPAPAAKPLPAPTPVSALEAAPPPAAAPMRAPAAPKPTPVAQPAQGSWSGHLACGASLAPGNVGVRGQAFKAKVSIEIVGQRLTWTRAAGDFSETLTGSFDAQGRFSAEGRGGMKDGSSDWHASASGSYQPRSNRIEAQFRLMRPKDGFVTRECTLVAEPGGVAAAAAAASVKTAPASPASPTPSAKPQAVTAAQGTWSGKLSCGALLNPPKNSTRIEPFEAKFKLEILGKRAIWTRESRTSVETATGRLENNGRLSVEGEGHSTDVSRSNAWLLKAQGEVLAPGNRIAGRAQIVRASDGAVARECTILAEHAPVAELPAPSKPKQSSAVPPRAAPLPALRSADGTWSGVLACGPVINSRSTTAANEAFTARLAIDVTGSRIRWTRNATTRTGRTITEPVAGEINADGSLVANGEGWAMSDSGQRDHWLVKAKGQYRASENLIEASMQMLMPGDKGLSVARECRLRAERA